jgi:cyclic pyranopterin phosphate synthase
VGELRVTTQPADQPDVGPVEEAPPSKLVDRFGREHRDLRLSLTDRCNLRCTYCMPAEGMQWLPGPTLLTTPELVHLVEVLVALGVREVRLTGGEPLLRPDVVDVVKAINELPTPPELSLTTNGVRLPTLARPLAEAGLRRVNISLDTLRADRFRELTRRDMLEQTLAGVRAAKRAGLEPVKVNTVLMRGVNDDEACDLLAWALHEGVELRFIEQMPLDPSHIWRRDEMVTAAEIHERLSSRFTLIPWGDRGSDPSERFVVDGGPGLGGTVGIIASVTQPFCRSCDRLRLTADGQLRNCLFAHDESDLRSSLREGASDEELSAQMLACVAAKKAGHGIDDPTFVQPQRPMSAIGG